MRSISILLVENPLAGLTGIRESLDKLDILYNLVTRANANEAVGYLLDKGEFGQRRLPDVILIDISEPGVNGLELLRIIREDPEWFHLKCFIVTTVEDKVDRVIAEQLGISGYINKPLKLNSLSTMGAFNLMIDLINLKSAR